MTLLDRKLFLIRPSNGGTFPSLEQLQVWSSEMHFLSNNMKSQRAGPKSDRFGIEPRRAPRQCYRKTLVVKRLNHPSATYKPTSVDIHAMLLLAYKQTLVAYFGGEYR